MTINKLLSQLKETKQPYEQFVISGKAQDLAQYRFIAGQINGLDAAIEMCRKLLKESGEFDE
jgi:hypothetical protein